MKIAFCVEKYYPNMSGVPVVTAYLAEGLASEGHDVSVMTKCVEGKEDSEERNGVHIKRFRIEYNILRRPIGEVKAYKNAVLHGGYEVLILECSQCVTTDALLEDFEHISGKLILHSHGFSGLWLKRFEIKRNLYHTIGNTINYYIWKHYYNHIFNKALCHIDEIVCLSKSDKDYKYLINHGIAPVVVSNCADDMFFDTNITENALAKYLELEKKYIVSVANYSEVKNQIKMLNEFYKYCYKIKDDQTEMKRAMVFVGTSRNAYYKVLLEAQKGYEREYGHQEVYFLTGIDRGDIPSIIKGADIYIAGSTWEAFSISLIESMAVGTPFISTDVGNAKELPGGVVIERIEMMHEQIAKIVIDNTLHKSLSDKGIRYARENCRIVKAVEAFKEML